MRSLAEIGLGILIHYPGVDQGLRDATKLVLSEALVAPSDALQDVIYVVKLCVESGEPNVPLAVILEPESKDAEVTGAGYGFSIQV